MDTCVGVGVCVEVSWLGIGCWLLRACMGLRWCVLLLQHGWSPTHGLDCWDTVQQLASCTRPSPRDTPPHTAHVEHVQQDPLYARVERPQHCHGG